MLFLVHSKEADRHAKILDAEEVIRISGELIVKSYENDTDAFELLQQAEDEITELAEKIYQTPYQFPMARRRISTKFNSIVKQIKETE